MNQAEGDAKSLCWEETAALGGFTVERVPSADHLAFAFLCMTNDNNSLR
jgi:hypothetical protein